VHALVGRRVPVESRPRRRAGRRVPLTVEHPPRGAHGSVDLAVQFSSHEPLEFIDARVLVIVNPSKTKKKTCGSHLVKGKRRHVRFKVRGETFTHVTKAKRSLRANGRFLDSKRCAAWVAVISAKNHKRQSVTAKREKSQTPKVLTAIITLPNLA